MTDSWPVQHFSQNDPAGPRQDDVPALLRRLAGSIEQLTDAEVQDIVFHHETDDEGNSFPTMTVYFHDSGDS